MSLKVGLLRVVFILGFGLLYLSFNNLIQSYPSIEKMDVYKGVLLSISKKSSRRGGTKDIVLLVGDKELKFKLWPRKETDLLEKRVGENITIWSYSYVDLFFLKRNKVAEIEVDGIKLMNSWHEVKKRRESIDYKYGLFLGFSLIAFSLFSIFKILKNN